VGELLEPRVRPVVVATFVIYAEPTASVDATTLSDMASGFDLDISFVVEERGVDEVRVRRSWWDRRGFLGFSSTGALDAAALSTDRRPILHVLGALRPHGALLSCLNVLGPSRPCRVTKVPAISNKYFKGVGRSRTHLPIPVTCGSCLDAVGSPPALPKKSPGGGPKSFLGVSLWVKRLDGVLLTGRASRPGLVHELPVGKRFAAEQHEQSVARRGSAAISTRRLGETTASM
jgi:hypothetical protein